MTMVRCLANPRALVGVGAGVEVQLDLAGQQLALLRNPAGDPDRGTVPTGAEERLLGRQLQPDRLAGRAGADREFREFDDVRHGEVWHRTAENGYRGPICSTRMLLAAP